MYSFKNSTNKPGVNGPFCSTNCRGGSPFSRWETGLRVFMESKLSKGRSHERVHLYALDLEVAAVFFPGKAIYWTIIETGATIQNMQLAILHFKYGFNGSI